MNLKSDKTKSTSFFTIKITRAALKTNICEFEEKDTLTNAASSETFKIRAVHQFLLTWDQITQSDPTGFFSVDRLK